MVKVKLSKVRAGHIVAKVSVRIRLWVRLFRRMENEWTLM